jgi:DNA-binding transcriptional MerR regulator
MQHLEKEDSNLFEYNLHELSEALSQKYGIIVSVSTLSRYVAKGLLKPDISSGKELLFSKNRLQEIAETIAKLKEQKIEAQLPPQQLLTPITQQPGQQPLTTQGIIDELQLKLRNLERIVLEHEDEIYELKLTLIEQENHFKKRLNEVIDYVNEKV